MSLFVPAQPKIYHIVHIDRLPAIIQSGGLLPDSMMSGAGEVGTTIGMSHIKARRRAKALNSHPDLHVGDCVPFYFCPRSVMLYVISRQSHPDLSFRGGQEPIVHLEADLRRTVDWARQAGCRWAFTTSNAGSFHFEDYADLSQLNRIDWAAVQARYWRDVSDEKQAEFLLERGFPWGLVERIGCHSPPIQREVIDMLMPTAGQPLVEVQSSWYYPEQRE